MLESDHLVALFVKSELLVIKTFPGAQKIQMEDAQGRPIGSPCWSDAMTALLKTGQNEQLSFKGGSDNEQGGQELAEKGEDGSDPLGASPRAAVMLLR